MNEKLFFAGIVVVILGLLILVYDYPQLLYMQTMAAEQVQLSDMLSFDRFQRIQIEFYAGVGILCMGAVILFFSKFPLSMFIKK